LNDLDDVGATTGDTGGKDFFSEGGPGPLFDGEYVLMSVGGDDLGGSVSTIFDGEADLEGRADLIVGAADGFLVGYEVGVLDGLTDGLFDGFIDGDKVGFLVAFTVGYADVTGAFVGFALNGARVLLIVGILVRGGFVFFGGLVAFTRDGGVTP
jgi:hypothetical protein